MRFHDRFLESICRLAVEPYFKTCFGNAPPVGHALNNETVSVFFTVENPVDLFSGIPSSFAISGMKRFVLQSPGHALDQPQCGGGFVTDTNAQIPSEYGQHERGEEHADKCQRGTISSLLFRHISW